MSKTRNEVTTTLRMSESKYAEFKEYSREMNISINSAIKISANLGLKMLKGEFQNVVLIENPALADNAEQT